MKTYHLLFFFFTISATAQYTVSNDELPKVNFKIPIDNFTEIELKFGNFTNSKTLKNVQIKNVSGRATKKDTSKLYDEKNRVIQKKINIINFKSFEYLSTITYDETSKYRIEKVNHGLVDTTSVGKLEIKNNQPLSVENVLYYLFDEEFNVYKNNKLVISLITEYYDKTQHLLFIDYNLNGDVVRIDDKIPTKEIIDEFKQGNMIEARDFKNTPINNGTIIFKYKYDKQNNWVERYLYKIENNKEILVETYRK